jgi:hypothetical protein
MPAQSDEMQESGAETRNRATDGFWNEWWKVGYAAEFNSV